MIRRSSLVAVSAVAAILLASCGAMNPSTPQDGMSFFVTSTNPGKGGDFGGLAGADRYCQALGTNAGASGRTWRAYLSANAASGSPSVDARDRIGAGPWRNSQGSVIATSVADLHSDSNKLTKQTALTEKGTGISGRGDPVNMHDMLTGSSPDGRAVSDAKDTTCGNWTKSGEGSALVGHHDRIGLKDDAPAKSWNSSHASQGCSLESLQKTGGGGLMYCFAQN